MLLWFRNLKSKRKPFLLIAANCVLTIAVLLIRLLSTIGQPLSSFECKQR